MNSARIPLPFAFAISYKSLFLFISKKNYCWILHFIDIRAEGEIDNLLIGASLDFRSFLWHIFQNLNSWLCLTPNMRESLFDFGLNKNCSYNLSTLFVQIKSTNTASREVAEKCDRRCPGVRPIFFRNKKYLLMFFSKKNRTTRNIINKINKMSFHSFVLSP